MRSLPGFWENVPNQTRKGKRGGRSVISLVLALVLPISATAVAAPPMGGGGQPTFQVTIDATASDGPRVPRALFSFDGLQPLASQASRLAQDAFLDLNPRGLFTRVPLAALAMEPDSAGRWLAEARAAGMEPVLVVSGAPEQAGLALERLNGSSSDRPTEGVSYLQFMPPAQSDSSREGLDRWYDALSAAATQLRRQYPGLKVGAGDFFEPQAAELTALLERTGRDLDFVALRLTPRTPERLSADLLRWDRLVQRYGDVTFWVHSAAPPSVSSDQLRSALRIPFHFARRPGRLEAYFPAAISDLIGAGDGAPLSPLYFVLWLFRDLDGSFLPVQIVPPPADVDAAGENTGPLLVLAARDAVSGAASAILYLDSDRTGPRTQVEVRLQVPPGSSDRIVMLARVDVISDRGPTASPAAVEAAWPLAAAVTEWRERITLAPGGAVALRVKEAPLADRPWVGIAVDHPGGLTEPEFVLTVRTMNTLAQPISGRLGIAGLPPAWHVEPLTESAAFSDLPPGGSFSSAWRVRATAPAAELGVYGLAILSDPAPAGSLELHSLPVRLTGVTGVDSGVAPFF